MAAVVAVGATYNYSEVTATAADAAGNVFLAGNFTGTVALGGTTLTSFGAQDVFVAKFNLASNQFIWAQQAGGTGTDIATALAVSGTSVYVAGYSYGFTAGFGTITLTNASPIDLFVAKLTDAGGTGSFVWAQQAGGTEADIANALAVSGTSVYVTGNFSSSMARFGTTTLIGSGNFVPDVFVAKLTDAGGTGSFVWAQQAGGTRYDYAYALAVSGTSVYVAGSFDSPTVSFGPTTLTNVGSQDVYVTKLIDTGSTGSFVWAQQAGGRGEDYSSALAVSGTSVYVAGTFANPTAGFGPATLTNPNPNTTLGFLAALTDPTLTATAAGRTLAPVQLFPNPAHRTATLRLPAGTAPAPLTLTDALGRAVRRYPVPAGPEAALDLQGLPAGLYLLRGAGPAQRLVVE